ncbi:hypothetical protein CSUB01_11574 [Colletotrichum sublineola]|uniref:Uncharacterized protein n=1 Tax=Colletotrichum sublineola TaxID=1173701 RepID=A0A066XTC5_COLSU|nr:hypothetical protein CSUB01_11574 [Colletotrichum sublineola]
MAELKKSTDYDKSIKLVTRRDWPECKRLPTEHATITTPNIVALYTVETNRNKDVNGYSDKKQAYKAIEAWVRSTVDPALLSPARMEILDGSSKTGDPTRKDMTLRTLLKVLKRHCAPNDSTTLTSVREEYLAVLTRANTNINAASWHADWQKCYLRGKQYDIPEVQGNLATKSFLRAVSAQLAPTWGREALNRVIENETTNKDNLSLSKYRAIFIALHHEETLTKGKGKVAGVYATLSDRSDRNPETHSSRIKDCPCGIPATCNPAEYPHVKLAVQGISRQATLKQTAEESAKIKERLREEKWQSVRYALINKGWIDQPTKGPKKRRPPQKNKDKDNKEAGSNPTDLLTEGPSEASVKLETQKPDDVVAGTSVQGELHEGNLLTPESTPRPDMPVEADFSTEEAVETQIQQDSRQEEQAVDTTAGVASNTSQSPSRERIKDVIYVQTDSPDEDRKVVSQAGPSDSTFKAERPSRFENTSTTDRLSQAGSAPGVEGHTKPVRRSQRAMGLPPENEQEERRSSRWEQRRTQNFFAQLRKKSPLVHNILRNSSFAHNTLIWTDNNSQEELRFADRE